MSTTTVELAPTEPQYEYFFRDNTFDNRREVLTGDKVVETFSEVPLVDIGGIFSDKYEERLRTAQRVAEVCKTVGFMYITNHGIPQELMDAVFDVSRKYHAQPVEVKKQEYIFNSETLSGYDVHYYQTPEGPKEKKGSFLFNYDPANDPQPPTLTPEQRALCLGLHNQWPAQMPELKTTMLEYQAKLLVLARQLIRTFALGLGLEENYFDSMVDAPFQTLLLQYYPPRPAGAADLDSLGAHVDYETFTILLQDMLGGLEILNKNGVYVPAPPIKGTFVINVGDFLQRISNDIFVSTVHRVRNTAGVERYSIPCFFSFNMDAAVEVIPACTSESNPPKYGPRNLTEYTAERRRIARENRARALEKGDFVDPLSTVGGHKWVSK